ncbi:MAG: 7-cyano-7-deazaguanine synthase QueC [Verrucomicrobiales bacterium]
MKVVVLVSGGMDSVTALYDAAAGHEVVAALSFDYGAKHNHRELPCAAWHAAHLGVAHRVVSLNFVEKLFRSDLLRTGGDIPDGHYEDASMKRTVVPFRNGIMLAVAAGFAESIDAKALVIAAHAGDHAIYPDCREEFLAPMAEAISTGTYAKLALLRPFISMTKSQIVERGRRLAVDFFRTWSCYKGGESHCGKCGTCVERREAFAKARVADPTVYASAGPLPPAPAQA